jgi:hypothetical protein
MTNSERERYDTDDFVQELATMKRAAAWRKPRLGRALAARLGRADGAAPAVCAKKGAARGGSRFSQGGVKSSGQEPLSVQITGHRDNAAETLTYG